MGCPHCGNEDIQVMELLQAWKENERLEKLLQEQSKSLMEAASRHPQERVVEKVVEKIVYVDRLADVPPAPTIIPADVPSGDAAVWKERYEAIREAYIKTRLEVSGSFGNWSGDTRRRVLENEISAELGFKV